MKTNIEIKGQPEYITLNKDISQIINQNFSDFTLKLKHPNKWFSLGKFKLYKEKGEIPTYTGYLDPNIQPFYSTKHNWNTTKNLIHTAINTLQDISNKSNQEIKHEDFILDDVGEKWKESVLKIFKENGYKINENKLIKVYKPTP